MTNLRFAVRTLSKTPSFTLGFIALLAVGIGATTLIFSLADAVLLRPLPVERPQELIRMVQTSPQLGTISSFPYAYYRALRSRTTTLSAVFGESSTLPPTRATLSPR